jgi:hypothetical protein
MNIEQKLRNLSILQMSGQEQQSPRGDNVEEFADLMMMASVAMPLRNLSLLDYLFAHNVPISPIVHAGEGDADVASILARSLYDLHPVKKVITEEGKHAIVDKKFTAAMVEELKINGVCGIWLEDFAEGDDIKILPCNHAFKSEAIMKWLQKEKAECPVCRFSFQSKEVNENQVLNLEDDEEDDRADDDADIAHNAQPEPEPAQDDNIVRVNNIASRLGQSVAGRANPNHFVSVPMNQLLQNVRMMTSSLRSREPMHAAMPLAGGGGGGAAAAPISQASYANAGREVRAEAIQRRALNANNNNNNNNYNIINNNYYYGMNNNHDINNNYDNNYYRHHIHVDEIHHDVISNQEQADIEEAIRRSLE